jgi:hypothetical protein
MILIDFKMILIDFQLLMPRQWYLKCGPGSISISWEPAKSENSQTPHRPTELETLGVEAQ